jgi:hypothetical protein
VQEEHLEELAEMSGQSHIVEFCKSDPGRFGDKPKVQEWLQKRRVMVGIYAVQDQKDSVDFADPATFRSENLTQVAYAWFGPETDKEGNDTGEITTAYRVGEAGRELSRERRHDKDDKFKLGLPLGRLVTAVATGVYGVDAERITLETWASNLANELYDLLGFVLTGEREEPRPTLEEVGTVINGNVVYFDEKKRCNMVVDTRLFKRLARTAVAV